MLRRKTKVDKTITKENAENEYGLSNKTLDALVKLKRYKTSPLFNHYINTLNTLIQMQINAAINIIEKLSELDKLGKEE